MAYMCVKNNGRECDCCGECQSQRAREPVYEEVYGKYYDSAGNYHWTGTKTGHHVIRNK